MMQTTPTTAAQNTCPAIAKAHAELIQQTQKAMMRHQDSSMWAVCGGVLEQASPRTAQQAVLYGDESAAQVLNQYIAYLEGLLQVQAEG